MEIINKIKDIGNKIIKLTEFGQSLHINDILPELKEIYDLGYKDGQDSREQEVFEATSKLQ